MKKSLIEIAEQQRIYLERRVGRLEELAKMNGDLFLFLVEEKNTSCLITESSVELVIMRFPGANVDFLGRASNIYTEPQIIRSWQSYNY